MKFFFFSFCRCAQQLTGLMIAVVTAVLYVFEAQTLRLYAPLGSGNAMVLQFARV